MKRKPHHHTASEQKQQQLEIARGAFMLDNTITLAFETDGGCAHVMRRQGAPGDPEPRITLACIPVPEGQPMQLMVSYIGDLEGVIEMLRRAGCALEYMRQNLEEPPVVRELPELPV